VKNRAKDKAAVEQIIGREGETEAFLSTGLFTLGGLGGGFAPRQLKRSTAIEKRIYVQL